MIHLAVALIRILAVLGALAASVYYLLCIMSAISLLHENRRKETSTVVNLPGISLLKPLKGVDPGMYENLRSHCLQNYPEFEIIFGVSDAGDAALEFVRKLQEEFPQIFIRIVVCGQVLGANVKVSNLAQMLPEARHEYLVVNDSDIRVEPNYLRQIAKGLTDTNVGLVTCLYRGVPSETLGSKLESLFISTDFSAGVLAARLTEGGIHFGLGSTLAFRRADLAATGDFESMADYLADDYELGRRLVSLGRRVELCESAVETHLPAYDFRQFFQHQLRWARTIRDSRPGGYAGLLATFGLPWSVLAVICAPEAPLAWGLAAAVIFLRFVSALLIGNSLLNDRQVARLLYLIPLRDFIGPLIWLFGFRGDRITWRGDSFALKKGKLVKIPSQF
jgi:ceramide glucosyltransferase